MSVTIDIRLERASKTYHPGETIKGVVVVVSKSALKVKIFEFKRNKIGLL